MKFQRAKFSFSLPPSKQLHLAHAIFKYVIELHSIAKMILEKILPLGINFNSAFLLAVHTFYNRQLFVDSVCMTERETFLKAISFLLSLIFVLLLLHLRWKCYSAVIIITR